MKVIKSLVAFIAVICISTSTVFAMGPTLSFMTEQVASVDKENALNVELGYFLGVDNGLEPFIGCEWRPRWNEEGEMSPPAVIILGVRNHFKNLVDPNSAIPFIPSILSAILNEDIEIKPYIGIRFSANIIDKDAGLMGISTGILVKPSPESKAFLLFEIRKVDTFGELSAVPDNQIGAYMGMHIRF